MKCNILAILFSCYAYVASAQITVYDINKTGPDMSSVPGFLTPFDGKLYLMATDGVHGYELWGIDSSAGAFMVADINPGSANALPGFYSSHTNNNFKLAITYAEVVGKEALFFVADDGVHGCELYLYDGTNSPVMIKEFIPGPQGIKDVRFLAAISHYVFVCEFSRGIWQYNLNTGDLKLLPGTGGVKSPTELIVLNDVLYANIFRGFPLGYILWKYNPATGDTAVIANNLNSDPHFATINSRLYYVGNSTQNPSMYEYDGTLAPSYVYPCGVGRQTFGWFNNMIYFCDSAANLCKYDQASKKVTIALKNTYPAFKAVDGFVQYKDKMYLSATDTAHDEELWEWDGINSARLIADLWPGVGLTGTSGLPQDFTVMPDGVYFVAHSSEQSTGWEVHRYKPFPATIQNLSFKGEVRAYPNPTTSTTTLELQLHTAQTLYVEVYNTEGRKVLAIPPALYSSGTSRVELDMRHLPVGNYFYHVRNKENATVVSGKLVKL